MQDNLGRFYFYLGSKYVKDFVKGILYSSFLYQAYLRIYGLFFLSDTDKKFIQFNLQNRKQHLKASDKKVEVISDFFAVEDLWPPYALTVDYFCKKYDVKFKSFVYGNTKLSPRAFSAYRSFCSEFEILKIKMLFSVSLINETKEELKKIKSKEDLIEYCYHGINIGIDVYESYLRDFNQETIDLNDIRFYFYLYLGISITQYWEKYLQVHDVKAILTSHDNYIWFNALCKLGYQKNITVILPHPMRITQLTHPFSMFDKFKNYSTQFSLFSDEQKNIARKIGKEIIDSRFSGVLGPETYYLNKSIYGVTSNVFVPELEDDTKPKVLIATHCFFDNPHAYNRILFPDFWEWLVFLGELSKQLDYRWFIKTHPDPTPGTEGVLEKFLELYPHFCLLPNEIPHTQVVKSNIMALLTCYGTIGEEYPLFGVPVINAGYNPRISFDINFSPKSIEEYERLIRNIPEIKKSFKIDPEKVYEFLYMHRKYSQESDFFYSSYLTLLQTRKSREGHMLSDFLESINGDRIQLIQKELNKIRLN